MKSLAMLAVSGLVAASFAYIAPAMADDMNNSGQSMQSSPSDNSLNPSGAPSSNDNMGNNSGNNIGSSGTGSDTNTSNTDQGSPDTATGDDDY